MKPEQKVLEIFEHIAAVPRASYHEEKISAMLQTWAEERGYQAVTDEAGNLLIRVKATPGYEHAPTLVLQGHLDMVCEKTPDSTHDFSRDPIRCIREGDWLHADQTTLGADNGIAVALAIALVEDPEVSHPPLELLFTVEEEIGLGGVAKLPKDFVSGRRLINLDSEEEGVFIVGCAGGLKSRMNLPVTFTMTEPHEIAWKITFGGLQGGHSGMDINKNRANANQLLARALGEAAQTLNLRIAEMRGGSAHNAIAREAEAVVVIASKDRAKLENALKGFKQTLQDEYGGIEDGLSMTWSEVHTRRAATESDSRKMIAFLQALPHGVHKMSARIAGFVETSNNLATVELAEDGLKALSSQRSMTTSGLMEITRKIESVAQLARAEVSRSDHYPAWKPNLNSPLLERSQKIYETLFGAPPKIETIHAGLECGQLGDIYPGMDMISLGATIRDPHSPQERLYIPSINKVWDFMVALLKSSTD